MALTTILGALLALASEGLKPAQKKAEELATKKQILSAVMPIDPKEDILGIFAARIRGIVIDRDGNVIDQDSEGMPLNSDNIVIAKEYKKDPQQRYYPVFIFHKEGDPEAIEAYIFAMYGSGLWDNIWAYIALDTDMNTIIGAVFDHVSETPGLGARITEQGVKDRYKGKKIYNEQGMLVSVEMLKGENLPSSKIGHHQVDGISGSTLTSKGLNKMLEEYFECYEPFIKNLQESKEVASL
ncbi:NADH:ubiquinone reductase (Na(+)-transporting) subunit C [Bacteroidota bacterium]